MGFLVFIIAYLFFVIFIFPFLFTFWHLFKLFLNPPKLVPNPVIPFKGTPQNIETSSAEEIEIKTIILNQRDGIKDLSRDYKPIQYSDYDKRYMPKG